MLIKPTYASLIFVLLSCNSVVAQGTPFEGNVFCGPRAVQRTLEHFSIEEDLLTLVQEVQWPDVERGASLASLTEALESRGIFTATVEIDKSQAISWDFPAIVHLVEGDYEHFVVWLPPQDGKTATVWDGAYTRALHPGVFNTLRSGPVLLTSEKSISPTSLVSTDPPPKNGWQEFASAFAIALLTGFSVSKICASL